MPWPPSQTDTTNADAMPDSSSAGVVRLADLTRTLGEPARQLAILGEGNTSLDCGDGTFWIKASGSRMGSVTDADFVRLEAAPLVALSDGPPLSEAELKAQTLAARVEGEARPSIEAILHALCIQEFGAASAAHCHPVSANSILCSDRSRELAGGILFPDQAVICGAETVFVEYAHPGIDLAKAVRTAIATVADRTGEMPRTVWLENHGLLALGSSVDEVLSIVEMADKFARILAGVLAVGEPRWLSPEQAGDLVAREDEIERRVKLASGH
jgi:rhamnose utilization protein RhaD (predicted bifunctional aldolase and dehydrogenase)